MWSDGVSYMILRAGFAAAAVLFLLMVSAMIMNIYNGEFLKKCGKVFVKSSSGGALMAGFMVLSFVCCAGALVYAGIRVVVNGGDVLDGLVLLICQLICISIWKGGIYFFDGLNKNEDVNEPQVVRVNRNWLITITLHLAYCTLIVTFVS